MASIIPPKTPGVFYNLKNKSHNPTLILLRMTLNRVKIVWSTSINADPKHWDDRKQRMKLIRGKEDEYSEINRALSQIEEIAISIFKEHRGNISPENFKLELSHRTGKKTRTEEPERAQMTLFEFIPYFIEGETGRAGVTPATVQKYRTVFSHLQTFAAEKRRKFDYNDIDWAFAESFSAWLFDEPRNFSANTANKVFSTLKTFLARARRLGFHNNQIPEERGFCPKKQKTRAKVRFTMEELQAIATYDFSDNKALDEMRDLFVVGCLTGLRYSDWHAIGERNIVTDEHGRRSLEVFTKKDKDHLLIPALPQLEAILKKHNGRLPVRATQYFDRVIKQVVRAALPDSTFLMIRSVKNQLISEVTPKWKKVASHAARRTFASIFYFEIGIPAAVLMRITGHSTEKQFLEYVDADQREVAGKFHEGIAKYYPASPDNL